MRNVLLLMFLLVASAADGARLKDLGFVRGVRANELTGYGLVVGLRNTGDDIGTTFTNQSVTTMLRRMGVQSDPKTARLRNVAAVMVTATLPPFSRSGVAVDVVVSSVGTATSLQGGTLLQTPLQGPDGQVYMLAQGTLSVGGYEARGNTGSFIQKNHLTTARVPGGGLVEREFMPTEMIMGPTIVWALNSPDFTTATRVAQSINKKLGAEVAVASDPSGVTIKVPPSRKDRAVFVADLESLDVVVDQLARVVINERTGTVVCNSEVRISDAAIAHGGLTVEVRESFYVSQPQAFSYGTTRVVPNSEVQAKEKEGQVHMVAGTTNLQDLVKALNSLGVTPRDLIAILQALKQSGALRAELDIQ